MKLTYDTTAVGGSLYEHDENEVGFRLEYRSIFDTFHRRMGQVSTWHIVGVKQAASQAALTTALASLESAYLVDFGNIVLKDNAGTNTAHTEINSSSFSGVQIAHFGYPGGPWNMNTEYGAGGACKRTFYIVATSEVRFGSAGELYAFRERVRQIGTGGTKRRYMGSLTGTPELQNLQLSTPIRFVQEGFVIGRGVAVAAPSPITALGNEFSDLRVVEVGTPMDIRVNGDDLYRTDYRYTFEATSASAYSLNSYTISPL